MMITFPYLLTFFSIRLLCPSVRRSFDDSLFAYRSSEHLYYSVPQFSSLKWLWKCLRRKEKNWGSTAKGINHIWITLIFLSELSEQPLKLEYESITTGWYEIIMVIKTNNYGLFWVDISSLITRLTTSNSLNHNADGFISDGYGWYRQCQLIWFVISCSSRVVASRSHSSLLLN